MSVRPLVVDTAYEGQHIDLGPLNVSGVQVTTGPEIVPIAALTPVFWVQGTAEPGGDGSDERPFNTIAAAVAAAPASGATLLICPENYSVEGTVNAGAKVLSFIGVAANQITSLPDITWEAGGKLDFANVLVQLVGTASTAIGLHDCDATSAGENCAALFRVEHGSFTGQYEELTAFDANVFGVFSAFSGFAHLTNCSSIGGIQQAGGTVRLLGCADWQPGAPLEADTIEMDRVSERAAALAGVAPSVLPTPLEPTNPVYGSGDGGDVVQAGNDPLSASVEYNSLSFTAGGRIRTETTILRVRNLLSFVAAGTSALWDYTGGGGAGGSGAAGGGAWGGTGGNPQGLPGTRTAGSGANGVASGAGASPGAVSALDTVMGGNGGAGGAGGAGGGGAGGASVPAATAVIPQLPVHFPPVFIGPAITTPANTPLPLFGGQPGQGGSSGGSAASGESSGGGGGGGRAGGNMVVYARGIELAPASAAPLIEASGQPGGNGADGTGGDAGGGGGGAGGGGGLVVIAYDWIIGTGPGNEISASGGGGGNGGIGGVGGSGGGGGSGGQVVLWNLLTNTRTVFLGAAGAPGTAGAPSVGGIGGAGGACLASFP